MVKIYLEGAAESKEQKIRSQEGFTKLLEKAGFKGRMPRIVACGGRAQAYEDFCTALRGRDRRRAQKTAYPLLLVDSEGVLIELTERVDDSFAWDHLWQQDQWARPAGSDERQALLMVTCMENWIAADRDALRRFYGQDLQESALPSLVNLESQDRHEVQKKLAHATRHSKKAYRKGNRSFAILAELDPQVLQ